MAGRFKMHGLGPAWRRGARYVAAVYVALDAADRAEAARAAVPAAPAPLPAPAPRPAPVTPAEPDAIVDARTGAVLQPLPTKGKKP